MQPVDARLVPPARRTASQRRPRRAAMRLALAAMTFGGMLGAVDCASLTSAPWPGTLSAADTCFPVERLDPTRQRTARHILLHIADGEGLYTVAGGLKPISSGFGELRLRVAPTVDQAMVDSLQRIESILPALRCADVGVVSLPFVATDSDDTGGRVRIVSLYVYHRWAVAEAVRRHAAFFASRGVTPSTSPEIVLAAVESADRAARWRGYGYLYGFPDAAVDFFVAAGLRGDSTGRVEPRDFRRIETYRKYPARAGERPAVSTFVYAVPPGAPESTEDRELRARAAAIYAAYAGERRSWVRGDGEGIVDLLRRWAGGSAQSVTGSHW